MRLRRYDPERDDPVAIYQAFLSGTIRMVYLGMWLDDDAARAVLEWLWSRNGIAPSSAPQVCNLPWFRLHRLTGLIDRYRNSPYLLLTSLYPGRWQPVDFREIPFAPDLQRHALLTEGIDPDLPPRTRRHQVAIRRADRLHRCVQCNGTLPEAWRSRRCESCLAENARVARAQRSR